MVRVCACLPLLASAVVSSFHYDIFGKTRATIIDSFGVVAGGKLEITYRLLGGGQVLFQLFNQKQLGREQEQIQAATTLIPKCALPSTMRLQTQRGADVERTFNFTVPRTDLYTLQMIHCREGSFSLDGTATMYNINLHGSAIEHLGYGKAREMPLFRVLCIIYLLLCAVWVHECYTNKVSIVPVHILLAVCVVTKLVSLIAKYIWICWDSEKGTPTSAVVWYNITDSLANMIFLAVLLLVSLGWTVTRNRLTQRERRMIVTVFTVYVVVSFTNSFCGAGQTSSICSAYLLTEYIVRSLIMLGIIVAMNFNITQLRTRLTEDRWSNTHTPKDYDVLNKLQNFRLAFLAYLLVPTALLIIKITVLSWRFEWCHTLLAEMLPLIIYVHIAYTFRPQRSCVLAEVVAAVSHSHQPANNRDQRPQHVI